MKPTEVMLAWGKILTGRFPSLSIEITRECPLRCAGCYAYDAEHLGGEFTLRQLSDRKGEDLVNGVMDLVGRYQPIHLSLVGGEPLVRLNELNVLLPKLSRQGVFVQVVTSAYRRIPAAWATLPRLNLVVSIDGLQPEHDARRKPATYERILENIVGHSITVHMTVTGPLMKRPGYLEEFLRFWSPRPEIEKIWVSSFTPQQGDHSPECLSVTERDQLVEDLLYLRPSFPKLDMNDAIIREFAKPPESPNECVFARTTYNISADLTTRITPCQFGGKPDCSRCGCIASMGLAALGHHKLARVIPLNTIFHTSLNIGKIVAKLGGDNSGA
ncbi:MAG: radical SAM protein [Acidobacteria bacterium]|nr:radical SAM protein [Acidobacteriota bacterium]MBI3656631.1 radical SAM protein [Acidobacteriota bacterium]